MFRNYRETPNLKICVEMHKSVWCDDFKNYSVLELIAGGELYSNPDILNCDDSIKEKVRRGYYNVYPFHPKYLKDRKSTLSGYIYVTDNSKGKMFVYYETPTKQDA
jgi:hypothetical protein